MRGLLVTGSDTGVGKTVTAAAVARQWRREGRPFRVCKPAATGAVWRDGRLLSEDALALAAAAGEDDVAAVAPFVYEAAAAPPVAARLAGQELTLGALAAAVRRRQPPGGAVLVEGVGGLLCPLTAGHTVADLAGELGLPLVVVVRRSLGTLNHSLLTLEAAARRGLRVVGVVVCETTPVCGVAEETNVEELRRRTDVPVVAVIPHGTVGGEEISAISAVPWWSLIG
jgi:dethiobiotin synthetase